MVKRARLTRGGGGDCVTVGNTDGSRSASNQSVLRVERALKTVSLNTVLRVTFYDSEISTFFSWCAWSLDWTVQMPGSDESF